MKKFTSFCQVLKEMHTKSCFLFFCFTVDRSALIALLRFVFDLLYNLFVQLCSSWQEFDCYSASRGPSAEAQLIFNARNLTRHRQTQQWSNSTVNPVYYCRVCVCARADGCQRVTSPTKFTYKLATYLSTGDVPGLYKKLSYLRGTGRCVVSVEILPILPRNSAETTCTTSPEPSTSCR